MSRVNHKLFEAFREDHAVLGRGLHELRSLIVSGDIRGIKNAARTLDQDAGAHIAFEEESFYPALKRFLSPEEVENMYKEHSDGAETLRTIDALGDQEKLTPHVSSLLLNRIDDMEHHVSECGQLFGALGGLNEVEKDQLFEELLHWRVNAPSWTDYARNQARRDE